MYYTVSFFVCKYFVTLFSYGCLLSPLRNRHILQKKKTAASRDVAVLLGAPAGTRIPGTLIKSQVLYQLSYRHMYKFDSF